MPSPTSTRLSPLSWSARLIATARRFGSERPRRNGWGAVFERANLAHGFSMDDIRPKGAALSQIASCRSQHAPDPLWQAAADPRKAYHRAAGAPAWPISINDRVSRQHIALLGTTGSGKSLLIASLLSSEMGWLAVANAPPSLIDATMEMPRWTIGADEDLGPTHPCLLLAFLTRLALAERDSDGPRAIDAHARRLAEAMEGDLAALDGLDPDMLSSLDGSRFALSKIPKIMAAARPISQTLAERRTLLYSCSQETAPASPTSCRL